MSIYFLIYTTRILVSCYIIEFEINLGFRATGVLAIILSISFLSSNVIIFFSVSLVLKPYNSWTVMN